VTRYFRFREHDRVEVAVDAFNALNRANVNEVTSVYGTYNFCGPNGLVPHGYKDATSIMIEQGKISGCPAAGPPTPNALFGAPRAMFNPRQLQFSLKYSF
jgi:hypothetical protein